MYAHIQRWRCIFIYHLHAGHTIPFPYFTTVDVKLTERSEEAEYVHSISKAEACGYCGTVLFVAEGGFPFREHQCGSLSSLSGFQSNCICLNDVCYRNSKREPGSCLPLTSFLLR